MLTQFLAGFGLALIVALAAYKFKSLSSSGAFAAFLLGGVVFGSGGLPWAALLLTFFISSSLLSRAFARRKQGVGEKFSKGSRRDWGQVAANGGVGAVLALLYAVLPEQDWIWAAFAGAMAAVNADTWATELGVLSTRPPRLITSGREVEKGTSGAISLLGTAAAFAGAMLVGIMAMLFRPGGWDILLAAVLGGMAGSLFDSFLGATVQAIYYCPSCCKETERYPQHICGTPTRRTRGWSWLNNDWVNLACSLLGALAGAGVFFWI